MPRPRYVFGEAWSIARSSPRQTAAAITLIALALYVPGLLALVSHNLARLAVEETDPASVVLTLDAQADPRAIATRLQSDARIKLVRIVSSDAALARFRRAYPDLGAALSDLKEAPFPPSIEVVLKPGAARNASREIAAGARVWPGVESAESEEEFSRRFRDAIHLVRDAGLFLGAVLTLAAVLSVASAVRLALDLHREEVGIMRLMGATEAAIRAPFWLYGALSGLAGGLLALALLAGTYVWARAEILEAANPLLAFFWSGFLPGILAAALPAAGAAAGLAGAAISVYRAEV